MQELLLLLKIAFYMNIHDSNDIHTGNVLANCCQTLANIFYSLLVSWDDISKEEEDGHRSPNMLPCLRGTHASLKNVGN